MKETYFHKRIKDFWLFFDFLALVGARTGTGAGGSAFLDFDFFLDGPITFPIK